MPRIYNRARTDPKDVARSANLGIHRTFAEAVTARSEPVLPRAALPANDPVLPIQLTIFTAAYAGATAGMTASGRFLSNPAAPTDEELSALSAIAFAFAERVDRVWADARVPSTHDVLCLQGLSHATFQDRQPPQSSDLRNPLAWDPIARALVRAVRGSENVLGRSGITSDPWPGQISAAEISYTPADPAVWASPPGTPAPTTVAEALNLTRALRLITMTPVLGVDQPIPADGLAHSFDYVVSGGGTVGGLNQEGILIVGPRNRYTWLPDGLVISGAASENDDSPTTRVQIFFNNLTSSEILVPGTIEFLAFVFSTADLPPFA